MNTKRTNRSLQRNGNKRKNQKYTIEAGEIALRDFGRRGILVGKISGDTVHKDLSAKTGFLKFPYLAIAHTIEALEYMREMGAVYIDVLEKDSGIHYRTTVQKYFDEGEYFYGGVKYGEQLKLALPKFQQTRDPEYTEPTDTDAQHYGDPSDTGEVMPLVYKSHAPVGVKYEPGIKQMGLWGD